VDDINRFAMKAVVTHRVDGGRIRSGFLRRASVSFLSSRGSLAELRGYYEPPATWKPMDYYRGAGIRLRKHVQLRLLRGVVETVDY